MAGHQLWSKALSSVETSMEPWAIDVPLKIRGVGVRPRDISCEDEDEGFVCVIPRGQLDGVVKLLPRRPTTMWWRMRARECV
ncbi:hypothetical protein EJ03DRAFT_166708 [Teratosphaeria nubilosa]|uniref:Uncharacterized protein n=1 Tax=Teratosphaeria nubilosa TaxID=161662 RepID=A0A6G1L1W6_9PEZI|nr:hypothetical protein EJ03DRAFT_166708 [Teratosphaeria nubilosa]